MPAKDEPRAWDLPHLKEVHQIPGVKTDENDGDFYSVKFYPYTEPGVDPIFAVVGGRFILIGRPPATEIGSTVEWIQFVVNIGDEGDEGHFTCAWSKDLEDGTPWLCVGGKYGKIQIINALNGELLRTLAGHGGDIEDLVVSPINPHILASASEDSTIRIWSLDPVHESQPCAAVLEGDGHRSEVLTIAFHSNGRYLLSGGIDRVINLWTLPLFPDANTGTETPTRIHYPHFSTSDISWDPIDCLAFHGDLILSKSSNANLITLFSITGFSSLSPPPPSSAAPTTHDTTRTTRSSFLSTTNPSKASTSIPQAPYFLRLLTFKIPDSEVMFARFSLFPGIDGNNPTLAFCNTASKMFFWDLDRLTEYYDWQDTQPWELDDDTMEEPNPKYGDAELPKRPRFLVPFQRRMRGGGGGGGGGGSAFSRLARERSPSESVSTTISNDSHAHTPPTKNASPMKGRVNPATGRGKVDWEKTREVWKGKHELRDAFKGLEPHREEVIKGWTFTGRQIAWSACGEWCVVCGSSGIVALFYRKMSSNR